MKRTLYVAAREFKATVLTKGFLFGLLILPLMILFLVMVFPKLIKSAEKAPRVEGQVAIIDSTGEIGPALLTYLEPEAIARRRGDLTDAADEAMPDVVKEIGGKRMAEQQQQALDLILGKVPQLEVLDVGTGADIEEEKLPIRDFKMEDSEAGGRLALVVVEAHAIRPRDDPKSGEPAYGSYDLYTADKLDDRIVDEIRGGMREAIVEARVQARGLDRGDISRLTSVRPKTNITVGETGEKKASKKDEIVRFLVPVAFMALLMMSVMTSGQQLMTNTIEEKSSRVVEMLLSAVSPMELMTGKIIGQLGVGILIMLLYGGVGVAGLMVGSLFGLLQVSTLLYAFIFFMIAFFMIASVMGAIGAAVNEIREAQTLVMPVILTIMIPYLLWMPISRDPNATYAVVLSFIPPINPFVMMLRLTSSTPPPVWQVWLSILIGIAGVYVALKMAAKVFRIGLLMYGKPPNFKTLIKWIRMA
ncbi:MAG: ABC transporter permease [Acidobacteria bacterium]|uniref:ABC transporter permease n=1 Tax=Candidatus Polarisedimenticola svalbardensis TaxID=2886004 RepID=A0A8J6Y2S0_9BACT|nr:ABC transporter permease [Candidatus Polarisedimenticola svalbardensis]